MADPDADKARAAKEAFDRRYGNRAPQMAAYMKEFFAQMRTSPEFHQLAAEHYKKITGGEASAYYVGMGHSVGGWRTVENERSAALPMNVREANFGEIFARDGRTATVLLMPEQRQAERKPGGFFSWDTLTSIFGTSTPPAVRSMENDFFSPMITLGPNFDPPEYVAYMNGEGSGSWIPLGRKSNVPTPTSFLDFRLPAGSDPGVDVAAAPIRMPWEPRPRETVTWRPPARPDAPIRYDVRPGDSLHGLMVRYGYSSSAAGAHQYGHLFEYLMRSMPENQQGAGIRFGADGQPATLQAGRPIYLPSLAEFDRMKQLGHEASLNGTIHLDLPNPVPMRPRYTGAYDRFEDEPEVPAPPTTPPVKDKKGPRRETPPR